MANPIAGQTYTVSFVTSEDLTGSTVTIEYVSPDGKEVIGVTPTSISNGTISFVMQPDLTQLHGLWRFRVKIVNAQNEIFYNSNNINLQFEPRF